MIGRPSIRRIICSIVAAGLIAAAVHFGLEYRRMDRAFYEWIDARPVTTTVDLSRPGIITAPFNQTCQVSHGEAFYLAVQRSAHGDRDIAELLRGLDGTITITDNDGNEIQSLKLNTEVDSDGDDEPILLAYFHPFVNGDYRVMIDVQSGAPALAGTQQTLHAEYFLCGLEQAPATIAGCLAFACGVSGLMMAFRVGKGFCQIRTVGE